MKHTHWLVIGFITTLAIGCNKEKAAINDQAEATKEAIDIQKEAVDEASEEASEQT